MASGLRFGTRLKSYDIREAIGRGAFGRVYLAFDVNLQSDLLPSKRRSVMITLAQDFRGIKRKKFAREAQLLGRFSHPNIVTVYDLFICPDWVPITWRSSMLLMGR